MVHSCAVAPYDGSGKFATVGDDDDNVSEKSKSRWTPSFASVYPERVVASNTGIVALAWRSVKLGPESGTAERSLAIDKRTDNRKNA